MPYKDPEARREYDRQYRAKNRERLNAYFRNYYANSPERRAKASKRTVDWNRRTRHGGVVPPEHPAPCDICGRAAMLHVDHDHAHCPVPDRGRKTSCGQCVRGFLCADCNRALGMFQDDPEVLRRAAIYVEERRYVAA